MTYAQQCMALTPALTCSLTVASSMTVVVVSGRSDCNSIAAGHKLVLHLHCICLSVRMLGVLCSVIVTGIKPPAA